MTTASPGEAMESKALQVEVATALRSFYAFLTELPWLEPDDVLEPPQQGWANINTKNFSALRKNDTVIELLKHLPYIRMDGPNKEYRLAWSTWPCDYRRDYFQKLEPNFDCWEIPETTERKFEFPEWVIPLTFGKNHGSYIMLDTTDGTAMRYEVQWLRDPVFEDDDPRAWRNQCENPGSTARLGDILDEWKDDYVHLRLVGQPSGPLLFTEDSSEEYKELRKLMIVHGWPDDFDRERCKVAMLGWEEKRLQNLIGNINNT